MSQMLQAAENDIVGTFVWQILLPYLTDKQKALSLIINYLSTQNWTKRTTHVCRYLLY